jgi:hypothetical protein
LSLSGKTPFIPGGSVEITPEKAFLTLFSVRGLHLHGITPQFRVGKTVEPSAGSLAITEQAVVSDYSGHAIRVSSGFLTAFSVRGLQLRGIAPEVTRDDVVANPAENPLALTGKDPILNRGFSYTIPVDEGGFSLTGRIPERGVGLLLTGHEPTADRSSETNKIREPARYELAITEQIVYRYDTSPQPHIIPVPRRPLELQQRSTIAVEIGVEQTTPPSLTLNMMQPTTVDTSPTFFLDTAPLVLTPQLPFINPLAQPDTDSLSVTGQDVSLKRVENVRKTPGVENLALTGQDVSTNPPAIKPGVTTLSLDGQIPSFSYIVRVFRKSLVIDGKQPERFERSYEIPVGTRNIRLAGQSPLGYVGYTITVGEGGLSATGQLLYADTEQDLLPIPRIGSLSLSAYTPKRLVGAYVQPDKTSLTLTPQAAGTIEKQFRISAARTRFVRLTTRYTIELLYR